MSNGIMKHAIRKNKAQACLSCCLMEILTIIHMPFGSESWRVWATGAAATDISTGSGLAMWRVCAIAPGFVSGWRAFSSVSLCK
jgi:hypothetical protein